MYIMYPIMLLLDLPHAFYQNYPQTLIPLESGVMSRGDWRQALLRQRNSLASEVFFVDISTLEDDTTASARNAWHKYPVTLYHIRDEWRHRN